MKDLNPVRRSLCLLLLTVLLLASLPFPASSTDIFTFDTEYDEDKGQITVHMHDSYAEKGTVDLLPTVKEAARKGSSLYIDAGKVKLYLNAEAVAGLAKSEEPILILTKVLKPETTSSDGSANETSSDTSKAPETDETLVHISFGAVGFPYGSVRVRVRYTPEDPSAVRVFARYADGSENELTAACAQAFVSFYPEELSDELEFVITERPNEKGVPKVLLLLVLLLGVTLVLSVVLLVLLRTGRLKTFVKKRLEKESAPRTDSGDPA